MNLLEQPKVFQEALCTHEAFRRLGFDSKDIYVRVSGGILQVVLLLQGGTENEQEFAVDVGILPMPESDFHALWPRLVETFNGAQQSSMRVMWDRSEIRKISAEFVAAIVAKGIVLPGYLRNLS